MYFNGKQLCLLNFAVALFGVADSGVSALPMFCSRTLNSAPALLGAHKSKAAYIGDCFSFYLQYFILLWGCVNP